MRFLEKDLEQIIFESGMDSLEKRGLSIAGKMFRQIKIGNYGIADLITVERPFVENIPGYGKIKHPGIITIYELKRDKISIGAFLQAIKYARGTISFLEKKNQRELFIIKIVLIGKTVDLTGSFCFLPDVLNTEDFQIEFYSYTYEIDGVYFDEHKGYVLKNEGF